MVSHRQTALLIFLTIVLITAMKWYNELRARIDDLHEEIEIVGDALISREAQLESLAQLGRDAINRCEKRKVSKLLYISECMESATTTTETNNKQIRLQKLIRKEQLKLDGCYRNRNKLEREYKGCISRGSETSSATEGSPLLGINSFLLFIGYARSGHSIVASLLDAHPHVVIAHELHALQRWAGYYSVNGTADRQDLFNEILENARSNLIGAKGYRSPNFTQKYYTLDVPGLYQGRYEDYIQVIGDKKGGSLVSLYKGREEGFQDLEKFQNFVGYPLKMIHIVRNPYDNIATKFLYGISAEARKEALEDNQIVSGETDLRMYVRRHLSAFPRVQRFIDYFGERIVTLHHEDLIEDPIHFLTTLCNYLVIACSDYYLKKASEIVFSNTTKSRYSVAWSQDTRDQIQSAIRTYEFLNRYSYED